MDNNKPREYIYAEAANGLNVRIPVDRYAEWKAEQDRIRRGEDVETDPEMVKRLVTLMKGEDAPIQESVKPSAPQQSAPPPTPTKEQKIMNFITSKRIAAVFSILLCISFYFGLLDNVFTKKVDTIIVYTQEDSNYLHGKNTCQEWDGDYNDRVYRIDKSKPIISTTLYECPDKIRCCFHDAKDTTITVKNYIAPLLISLPVSGLVFFILTNKKKWQ